MTRAKFREEAHCCEKRNRRTHLSLRYAAAALSADSDPCGLQFYRCDADRRHPRFFPAQLCDALHDAGAQGHDYRNADPRIRLGGNRNDSRDAWRDRFILFKGTGKPRHRDPEPDSGCQCRCRHRLFHLHSAGRRAGREQGYLYSAGHRPCDLMRSLRLPLGHAENQTDGSEHL